MIFNPQQLLINPQENILLGFLFFNLEHLERKSKKYVTLFPKMLWISTLRRRKNVLLVHILMLLPCIRFFLKNPYP